MNDQFDLTRNSEIKFFLVLVIVLMLMLGLSFFFSFRVERKDSSVPTETALKLFPKIELEAKAVYVYDMRTQSVLFAKNEDTRLSLASLTKIMSALVAEDLSPLYGTVIVSDEALKVVGDNGLYRDEKWSLKNLLDFSLVTSSNDGMRAVALSLGALSKSNVTLTEIIDDFVKVMNVKAQELSLKNTYFLNETGLDLSASSTLVGQMSESLVKGGAYGTARDMNTLFEYVLIHHPALLVATKETVVTFQSLDNRMHVAKNTNTLVSEIPRLVGSKTGLTDTAGGNLVFIFDPDLGRPIVVSILGSTGEGRFNDARIIINAVMQYIGNN